MRRDQSISEANAEVLQKTETIPELEEALGHSELAALQKKKEHVAEALLRNKASSISMSRLLSASRDILMDEGCQTVLLLSVTKRHNCRARMELARMEGPRAVMLSRDHISITRISVVTVVVGTENIRLASRCRRL